MITLFIIFGIICIVMMSRKDKHNAEEDAIAISSLPSFKVEARSMSTLSKVLNLAIVKSELLQSFSYSNEIVSITMQNGKNLTGNLKDLSVQFEKPNGTITYVVKCEGKKVSFYQTSNITGKEWEAINSVLCLAGTTRGRDMFSKAAKYTGYLNVALKAIKALS